jgi:5-formyltetrahydrofolate cyclo-ligase
MQIHSAVVRQKQRLRFELLHSRKSQSKVEIQCAGHEISRILFEKTPLFSSRIVGMYASDEFEVPTRPIFDLLNQRGIRCAFPRVDSDSLRFHLISDWSELRPGFAGILEPHWGREVLPSQLDVLLVPAVGFDHHRNRIGRGRGFYDRLLSDPLNRPKSVIGIAFHFQIASSLPVSSEDQKVDRVITEKGIL